MRHYEAVVIGAGALGCFAARNLRRWKISALLLESGGDVCTGITRANSAVIYPGYDNRPGSMKAAMTVKGNKNFPALCRELELPFLRRGSLLVSYGERSNRVLRDKLEQGRSNGVEELRLLSGREAEELEPMLKKGISSALYAGSTGTVNPWQLGIAACENAIANGCELSLNTRVVAMERQGKNYIIKTDREEIASTMVINCAGMNADKVQELLFPPRVRLFSDAGDYLVLDKNARSPEHIIFQETESGGKGLTVVPTVEGSLLLEGPRRKLTRLWATEQEGIDKIKAGAAELLPGLNLDMTIRSFAAVRPNPRYVRLRDGRYRTEERNIGDFVIDRPEPGFISLIGIKTPGLSCADELGAYIGAKAAEYLSAEPNRDFDGRRRGIVRPAVLDYESRKKLIEQRPEYGDIICRCEEVSRGEILEAIRRGAATVEAVKRRTGACLGRCQGSRCRMEIEELLEVYRHGQL